MGPFASAASAGIALTPGFACFRENSFAMELPRGISVSQAV